MQSWYEENLFRVIEKKEGIPVYTIKNIRKSKDVRVLHRNKLLRVNEMPLDVFEEVEVSKKDKEKKKNSKRNKMKETEEREALQEREVSTDSDSEYDLVVVESRGEKGRHDKERVNTAWPAEMILPEEMALPLVEQANSDEESGVPEEVLSPDDTAMVTEKEYPEIEDVTELLEDSTHVTAEEGDVEDGQEGSVENQSGESGSAAEDNPDTTEDCTSSEDEVAQSSDSDTPQIRRSRRGRIPKRMQTFEKLGGNLVAEEIPVRKVQKNK